MNRPNILSKLAAGVLTLAMIFSSSASVQAEEAPAKKIVINSASRTLSLYEGSTKLAMYPLGLGKVNTPTPVGYFKIMTKEVNPPWINPSHPEYEVPSGPNNPLGYRWMQIRGNYGIHGTNNPNSIGHYVSNGCIRMQEKDVEALFDTVKIGTPVEITYNRVVVEKVPDGNVAYYVYPDGYRWQSVSVDYVNGWLEPYGVSPFESDEEIEKKIRSSNGEPTYIGKPYNIEVDGQKIDPMEINGRKFLAKAVRRDHITYLPVVPLAMTLKTKLEWRASESTLKTSHGTVMGYEFKKQIYCNADDVNVLFNIDGGLQNISDNPDDGKIFKFQTLTNQPTEIPSEPAEETPEENSEETPETPADDETPQTPEENSPTDSEEN